MPFGHLHDFYQYCLFHRKDLVLLNLINWKENRKKGWGKQYRGGRGGPHEIGGV